MRAPTPLGIIAGRGNLPRRLIAACARIGRPVFVLGFTDQTDLETLEAAPSAVVRLGAVGQALDLLRRAGVCELVMAGKIERPSLLSLQPDARGMKLLARIGMRAFGDDGLLRIITDELEQEGFKIIAVPDVLPGHLARAGIWGRCRPDEIAKTDIAHGINIARLIGEADIGQAVIVQQGIVLGVEAIEGTDALIERCSRLARPGPGPVVVKGAKPQQDDRLDLPVIGPTTLLMAARAGLRGIAVEAGRTLIIEPDQLIAEADARDLFLFGWEAGA